MASPSPYQPVIRSLLSQCTRQQQYHRPRWQTSRTLGAPPSRRNFSHSPTSAYPGARVDPRAAGMKSANKHARPSMKVTMQKMQKDLGDGDTEALIVKDLGLLEKTLIYPTGENKPSLTSPNGFSQRLKLFKTWVQTRLSDLYGQYVYKKASGKGFPVAKLQRKLIVPTAREIHKRVYTAFAQGDRQTLQKLCVESVLGQYMSRLARRPANERMRWSVIKEVEKPRLVSHRGAKLPMLVEGANGGMRQCVIRMKTLQRLQVGYVQSADAKSTNQGTASMYGRPRVPQLSNKSSRQEGDGDDEANVKWRSPTERVVTEYVVIQRWLIRGVEQPWVLWGFADETTAEDLSQGDPDLGMKPIE